MADIDSSPIRQDTGTRRSSVGWSADPLGFLIAPIDRETFLSRHYESAPLINVRNEPDRYRDLLSVETLDEFIAVADLQEGMIELTDQRHPITPDAYIDERGQVSRTAVAEHYHRGATIILPHLHTSLANLGLFCRSLEEVFSCHVQTNVYLTPATQAEAASGSGNQGNQGFPIHYDNHDVFVLQVAGSKKWQFYGTPIETPYRGEGFQLGRYDPGEITGDFTLEPGDCLYLPRGVMHDARNVGPEPSLHITVGLITKTWADLILESISELALSEPAFRRSLPPGFAARDYDREAARGQFERLAAMVAEQAQMDGAFDLLADNFIRGRRPDISGVIAGAPIHSEGAIYRRRRYLPWNVADDDGKLVVIAPGGDLEFAAEDGEALDIALSGERFGIADLRCADPASLLRRLWTAGFLERV